MPRVLKVAVRVLDRIRAQARAEHPLECCGLLAGAEDIITEAFPTANVLASSREFFIDPGELIATLRELRERGLRHLGLYHSHPHSDNTPSERDRELAFYPSCAYLIVTPGAAARPVRAFDLANGNVSELEIEAIFDSLSA